MQELPKVELHLHLDCSLSYQVVSKLKPGISYEAYRQSFVAPPKCPDLADYIKRAISAIELMQTKDNLSLVVFDLFEQLLRDHVIYAELRFAPLEHVSQGLSAEEVVSVVNQATIEAINKTGVEAGIILCTLRHYSENMSLQTAELVERFKGTKVVGFDIAADEAGYPIDNHVAAFNYINNKGIPCTAHAGEALGAESVWETLENFRPLRIGHGVRSAEDQRLLDYLKQHQIHLEVCPTSNVQTNVFATIKDHNISTIFDSGVSMSVNTDCRTISDVTLTSEYQLLHELFGWSKEQLYRCDQEALRHAFCSEELKLRLLKKLQAGYKL